MSKIDHKVQSEKLMDAVHDWQSEEGLTDHAILTVTIESLQQATLYAAEQQRVANLIAYQAALTAFQGEGARLSPAGRTISDALESQIEKALGFV